MLDVQRSRITKCLVYDDDSPEGDPFAARCSAPFDAAAPLRRSTVALRALLSSELCGPSFSLSELGNLTPHGAKHLLPTVNRNCGEKETITNEIGKWSGSSSQTHADPHVGAPPSDEGVFPITEVYSHEALGDGGIVCRIMERVIGRVRSRVAEVGDDALPPLGGFGYYARDV